MGERAGPARGAAERGLTPAARLTTGDSWNPEHNPPTGSGRDPQHGSPDLRRSRAYIERFRKRIPLGRAIRLMCGSCMGGEAGQMPRGEVAQAIDECGSCTCPLWPFRFGHDPWRPELSEAKLAAVRRAGPGAYTPRLSGRHVAHHPTCRPARRSPCATRDRQKPSRARRAYRQVPRLVTCRCRQRAFLSMSSGAFALEDPRLTLVRDRKNPAGMLGRVIRSDLTCWPAVLVVRVQVKTAGRSLNRWIGT